MPTTIRTNFRPSVHGFKFSNEFRNHVVDVGPVKFTTDGRCGGMAALALDFFFAGVPVPQVKFVDHGLGPYSGPAVCRWPDGTTHAIVIRTNGSTAYKRGTDVTAGSGTGVWADWETLTRDELAGQQVFGEPAVCSWGQGRIDLFTVKKDKERSVSHLWCEGGRWHNDGRPCRPLYHGEAMPGSGGVTSVAAASSGPNRLELFGVRGGRLVGCRFDNGWVYADGSSNWFDMGMPGGTGITSEPAAASDATWTAVAARAKDNAVWLLKTQPGGSRQEWRSLGGVAVSAPALSSTSAGHFEAYVVGTTGQMYTNVCEGDNWSGWGELGAPPVGLTGNRPAALAAPGYKDVYAMGKDNLLWHRQFSGGSWQEWRPADRKPTAQADNLAAAVLARLMQNTIDPLVRAGAAAAVPELIRAGAAPPDPLALLGSVIGGAIGYAGLGSNQKNISWLAKSAGECWYESVDVELPRIFHVLGQGKPVMVGLISSSGLVGHQVVAWGADVGVSVERGTNLPGPYTFLHIYDNEYPGCDTVDLMFGPTPVPPQYREVGGRRELNPDYDPRITPYPGRIIHSATGGLWKGVFSRDDYAPQPPPRL